jgi:hypothetical protein
MSVAVRVTILVTGLAVILLTIVVVTSSSITVRKMDWQSARRLSILGFDSPCTATALYQASFLQEATATATSAGKHESVVGKIFMFG